MGLRRNRAKKEAIFPGTVVRGYVLSRDRVANEKFNFESWESAVGFVEGFN